MAQHEERSDISIERKGAVAYLRIQRGSVNAVGPQTMRELSGALDAVRDDAGIRAVVIGHAGPHFIAGADFGFLQSLRDATPQQIRDGIYERFQQTLRRIYHFPKPTVAAIGGAAITVGCELALACDFRLVTPRASFQESWIRLGLLPPLGGLKMLPALVGYGLAADMILRGRKVDGAEAAAKGLAHELVPAEELEARAWALAGELAESAPLAYRAAKAGLRRALENSLEDTFSAAVNEQALLIQSEDFREGVSAVTERRAPRFRGR